MRCRGLFWTWSDRVPDAPTDEAASAALAVKWGRFGFAALAEPAALVDFPDELGKDFGTKPEARALVDFPDATEEALGATAEPEALGASRLG